MEFKAEEVLEELEGKSYEEGLDILKDAFSEVREKERQGAYYCYCADDDSDEEVTFRFTYGIETAEYNNDEIFAGNEQWEIVEIV